jgi:hypothetical protein
MRFKEAVLKGCETYPKQCVVLMYYPPGRQACVMGAALAGAGVQPEQAERHWPFLAMVQWPSFRARMKCPVCRLSDLGVYVVVHLNDRHGWSREKIAEWADAMEPAAVTGKTPVVTERVAVPTEAPREGERAANQETPEEEKREEEELVPA